MQLISNYLDKKVISIYEAKIVGKVKTAYFDRKMKKVYSLALDTLTGEIRIPINKIITSEEALIIKNLTALSERDNSLLIAFPIGASVYTTEGKSRGLVRDISFNDRYEVQELYLDDGTVSGDEVASMSNNLVILKAENFIKLQAPRTRKPTVKIPKQIIKKTEQKSTPARIISDYSFLLGRRVLSDLYSTQGELIITENSKISAKTVDTAREYGKLVELTVGSRLIE